VVVLRPTWVSTLSGPVLWVLVIGLLMVTVPDIGRFMWISAVVFSVVFIPIDRRRGLELGPDLARRLGPPGPVGLFRGEVRDVVPRAFGGVTLIGSEGRSLWALVGDLPLGYVSKRRAAFIGAWAFEGRLPPPPQ